MKEKKYFYMMTATPKGDANLYIRCHFSKLDDVTNALFDAGCKVGHCEGWFWLVQNLHMVDHDQFDKKGIVFDIDEDTDFNYESFFN